MRWTPQRLADQVVMHLRQNRVENNFQEDVDHSGNTALRIRKDIDQYLQQLGPVEASVLNRVRSEFHSAGPLEELMSDVAVTEIMVNSPNEIYYEANGKVMKLNDAFLTELSYRQFLQRLCEECGAHYNLQFPYLNSCWRDFRVHLIAPPLSPHAIVLTLRRQGRNSWSLDMLLQMGWCQTQEMEILKQSLALRKNILFVGGTGSGKTSVLNAALSQLPDNERCIVIEDTDEISLPMGPGLKLLTRQDPGGQLQQYTQEDLLKQSLRMRPDRIVVGEIRGDEAKDFLMAISTGHRGSMASLHADNAQQALIRLEMLVQLGAPQWDLKAIRRLIYLGLDLIVVVERSADGVRRLKGIHKVSSLEESGFLLERALLASPTRIDTMP